jgi:hypothetical protein
MVRVQYAAPVLKDTTFVPNTARWLLLTHNQTIEDRAVLA